MSAVVHAHAHVVHVHVCGVLTSMIASYMTGLLQGERAKDHHDQEKQARLAGEPDHGRRRGDVRGGIMWPNAGCMFLPCMHENAAGLRFHQNAVKCKMMRQMPDALQIC